MVLFLAQTLHHKQTLSPIWDAANCQFPSLQFCVLSFKGKPPSEVNTTSINLMKLDASIPQPLSSQSHHFHPNPSPHRRPLNLSLNMLYLLRVSSFQHPGLASQSSPFISIPFSFSDISTLIPHKLKVLQCLLSLTSPLSLLPPTSPHQKPIDHAAINSPKSIALDQLHMNIAYNTNPL